MGIEPTKKSLVSVRFGQGHCSGSVVVYQSHEIALQYMCILHSVLQSGGLSQLKCLGKTHTDKNMMSFMKGFVITQISEFFTAMGIEPLP